MAQEECAKAVEARARIVSLSDSEYPSAEGNLRPTGNLFVKGSVEVLSQPGIAMVGRGIDALRQRHGGAARDRPGGAGIGDHQWISARSRYGFASRRGCGQGQNRRGAGHGNRHHVSKENTRLTEQIVALGGALITEFR